MLDLVDHRGDGPLELVRDVGYLFNDGIGGLLRPRNHIVGGVVDHRNGLVEHRFDGRDDLVSDVTDAVEVVDDRDVIGRPDDGCDRAVVTERELRGHWRGPIHRAP